VPSEPGYDIQTTIDINIQDVAEASLLRHLLEHQANYGCVVVMEVATGEIKAMANLGRLPSGNYAETYNYAVGQQGRTEPGSTFKLASIIALLEEAKIDPPTASTRATACCNTTTAKCATRRRAASARSPVPAGLRTVVQRGLS
jgi:cell division protein FtsI/penicillin-binding protein 2